MYLLLNNFNSFLVRVDKPIWMDSIYKAHKVVSPS